MGSEILDNQDKKVFRLVLILLNWTMGSETQVVYLKMATYMKVLILLNWTMGSEPI